MRSKKLNSLTRLIALTLFMHICPTPCQEVRAGIPIAKIIQEAIIKVVKAFDLMIQRLQTKTIMLQNIQKTIENKLSELKLDQIASWTKKQRDLYKQYYDELWKIKKVIAQYSRIKKIMVRQREMSQEYIQVWAILNDHQIFSDAELGNMSVVYTGIVNESLDNIGQLLNVIESFAIQMSDAERLAIIDHVAQEIEMSYSNLRRFNLQNIRLALSRSSEKRQIEALTNLYNLQK